MRWKRTREIMGERGAEIAELAVTLPFLMVMLVAIFDFGSVLNTRQKINNAAREGARFAANEPTSDLSLGASAPSIAAVRDVVNNYMVAANLNTCGLATATPSYNNYVWTYTTSNGCPTNLVLIIEREVAMESGATTLFGSRVTVSSPIQWHFSTVIKLLFPNSAYPGPVFTIRSDASMLNLAE